MAKNPKTKRTQIQDLPVAEQELTAEEMEKVEGGGYYESRDNYDRSCNVCGKNHKPYCPPPKTA